MVKTHKRLGELRGTELSDEVVKNYNPSMVQTSDLPANGVFIIPHNSTATAHYDGIAHQVADAKKNSSGSW